MIINKIRKEICLLIVFAIIVSLTPGQTIIAAEIQSDTDMADTSSENTEQPVFDTSIPDIPDTNQTDVPAAVNEIPILNTDQIRLIAGGDSYELHVFHAVSAAYELSADGPSIATLSNETAQSVLITPVASGTTVLTVTAVGTDGMQTLLSCQITISELSLSKESVDIYLNDEEPALDISLRGIELDEIYYATGNDWEDGEIRDALISDARCTIRTGNSKIADAWFDDGMITVKGKSKGVTNARINIYGVSLSIKINVHHYTLNKYAINTYTGSPIKSLKLNGAGGHKVTWVSGNKNVASVSNTGIVTIRGIGTTKITAKVNKRKVFCIVSVSSKTSYRVVRDARAISKKKNIQYSQTARMSPKYYDCSSLVYRCYRPYGIRFGYTNPSWAPTAADEAYWCAVTGRKISSEAIEILNCKLLPGDTIYYSFEGDNGRYLDIDHTAIFSGYAYDADFGYYGTVIEASSTSNTVAERMYYASDSIRLIGRPAKI